MGHRISDIPVNPNAIPVTRFIARDGGEYSTEAEAELASQKHDIVVGLDACTCHGEVDYQAFLGWLFNNFTVMPKPRKPE